MAGKAPGTLDYRDDRFVARFAYDAALVAEIKALKHCMRPPTLDGTEDWVIERYRPSVARIVRIGRDREWHFTAEARKALRQMQDQADAAEFSVDVVQGSMGEPWFLCRLGDDYDLREIVQAVQGAVHDDADDTWWVPATDPRAAAQLLAIVTADDRLELSAMAERLLQEPEDALSSDRASVGGEDEDDALDDDLALGGTWDPSPVDYEMHQLSSAVEEPHFRVSPALRGTLRPYQIAGVRYLSLASNAFLADELGLGKTVQALATIETQQAYPALILCPAALQLTWVRECQRWLPEGKTTVALQGSFESVPLVDVLIVNYEQVARHQQLLAERPFEAIVADESHYLRKRDARRTQAAIEIATTIPTLRLRLCLSSMPMSEQPIELAGQLEFLGVLEEEFGGFWSFADRYCAPKDDGAGMRFGAARMDELAQRLRSTCYMRRTKTAVQAQLPARTRAIHWLELEDRERYGAVEESAREALRGDAREDRQRLLELERVLHECGRQKTASIARWVASFLDGGQPLAVFAQHPDVLAALVESFPKAVSITRDDDARARQAAVSAFQAGEAQLILCSQHAAGVAGLLTRASHIAFAELAWSAQESHEQIHSIGRQQGATVWYLVGDGTIDEQVIEVIARKHVMAGELHERVLLEVAGELARMTEPRAQPVSAPRLSPVVKVVG